MTDPEQNQFDSAEVTYDYLQMADNVIIWTPLDAFAEGVTAVQGSINILHSLIQIQAGKTEGITADKDRLRQSITTRLIRAAKAAISFGNATDNGDLVAQANALNSKSEIDHIKGGLLADTAQAFYAKALAARTADLATAAKYGFITGGGEKLLAPLLAAITAYAPMAHGPQGAINARANATASIASELHRLMGELKDLDDLAPQFEEDQPDFVAGYHQARQIIDRGSGGGGATPPAGGPGGSPKPGSP
jgi:hypothetical protein